MKNAVVFCFLVPDAHKNQVLPGSTLNAPARSHQLFSCLPGFVTLFLLLSGKIFCCSHGCRASPRSVVFIVCYFFPILRIHRVSNIERRGKYPQVVNDWFGVQILFTQQPQLQQQQYESSRTVHKAGCRLPRTTNPRYFAWSTRTRRSSRNKQRRSVSRTSSIFRSYRKSRRST